MTGRYEPFPITDLQKLIEGRTSLKRQIKESVIADSAFMDKFTEQYKNQAIIRSQIDAEHDPLLNIHVQLREFVKAMTPLINTVNDTNILKGINEIAISLDPNSFSYERLINLLQNIPVINSQPFKNARTELLETKEYSTFIEKLKQITDALQSQKSQDLQTKIFENMTLPQIKTYLIDIRDSVEDIVKDTKNAIDIDVLEKLNLLIESGTKDKEEIAEFLEEIREDAREGTTEILEVLNKKQVSLPERLKTQWRKIFNYENFVEEERTVGPLDVIIDPRTGEGFVNKIRINSELLFRDGILKEQKGFKSRVSDFDYDLKNKDIATIIALSNNQVDYSLADLKDLVEAHAILMRLGRSVGLKNPAEVEKMKEIRAEIDKQKTKDSPPPTPTPQKKKGKGLKTLKNPEDEVKRLSILIASYNAGNKNNKLLKNEVSQIIDSLLKQKKITKLQHKKVFEKYVM